MFEILNKGELKGKVLKLELAQFLALVDVEGHVFVANLDVVSLGDEVVEDYIKGEVRVFHFVGDAFGEFDQRKHPFVEDVDQLEGKSIPLVDAPADSRRHADVKVPVRKLEEVFCERIAQRTKDPRKKAADIFVKALDLRQNMLHLPTNKTRQNQGSCREALNKPPLHKKVIQKLLGHESGQPRIFVERPFNDVPANGVL